MLGPDRNNPANRQKTTAIRLSMEPLCKLEKFPRIVAPSQRGTCRLLTPGWVVKCNSSDSTGVAALSEATAALPRRSQSLGLPLLPLGNHPADSGGGSFCEAPAGELLAVDHSNRRPHRRQRLSFGPSAPRYAVAAWRFSGIRSSLAHPSARNADH